MPLHLDSLPWLAIYSIVGWGIRAGMLPVILRRQFAPGASVAWLGIVFLHPYIGIALYLTFGENRLGPHRITRHRELIDHYRPALQQAQQDEVEEPQVEPPYEPMVLQAEKVSGMPVLGGNAVEFLTTSPEMVGRLIADLDAAKKSAHLLYYMFMPDETGRRIADAVARAARRGVSCRVLVDGLAGRAFFRRSGLSRELVAAGVKVAAALPVTPIKRQLARMDLRNHRKLAVIDGAIAFAGSHNLVNPDYGGRRGAPWVDITGRITGPIVVELSTVFAEDWAFETGELLEVSDSPPIQSASDAAISPGSCMQIVPTGPTSTSDNYRRVLLAAVQSARHRLILTTPYFVPDETTLVDLMMAADRGVEVSLLLPQTPDQLFSAAAGRAHFARLLEAGVDIYLYRPGLLHCKSVTVDDAFAVFGSANLDVRSFQLNFELSILMYGREVTDKLRRIQLGYIADSNKLELREWNLRPTIKRYADSAISLLSPLL